MSNGKMMTIVFVAAICAVAAITFAMICCTPSACAASTDDRSASFIQVEGIDNARQLGGYIGADGRRVKAGLLLRTGALAGLSAETASDLAQSYSIQYVVDFRMGFEREKAPDQEIPGAQNVWINLFEVDMSNPEMVELMRKIAEADSALQRSVEYAQSGRLPRQYTEILLSQEGQQGYAKFFDLLLDADGAVLWHCTHGKDRTGVAAALLLYALGVDENVILQEFLLTNEVYQEDIARLEAGLKAAGYDEAIIQEAPAMAGVKGEYLEAAFEAVKEEYGSMEDYLRSQLGVTDEKRDQLREKYLETF